MDQDLQAGRDVLELFARLLAHRSSLDTAFGAELLFGRQVVDDLLPREARGKSLPAMARFGLGLGRRGRKLDSGLAEEQELLVGVFLGFGTVALSQELFELALHPLDLEPQFADRAMGFGQIVG
jgi:hypothetical protein